MNTRSGSGVIAITQERVDDFVVVNQGIYTAVGEIKSQGIGDCITIYNGWLTC